nr:SURF1 family cytochrome oxidase biogenesis protein [Nakamurella flavida]
MACFAVLAPWQWDRHTERDAQNASITAAAAAPAVPVAELMSTAGQPAPEAVWHPVTATGTYLSDATVYVRLRQDANGQPVSEVIVPLQLDDGTLLMVDRGYIPFETAGSAAPVPAGRVTVTGRVQLDQTDPRNRMPSVQDGVLQAWAINGPQLTAATGVSGPVLGGYVQLVEGAPGVLVPVGVPQIDSGPFLSYAFQWIAFGVIAFLGMGFFVYREAFDPRDAHDDRDDDSGDEPEPTLTRTDGARTDGADEREPAATGGRRSRRFDRSQLYDD